MPACLTQLDRHLVIFAWVFVMSLVVWLGIKDDHRRAGSGGREYEGVDIGECGLEAYPEFVPARVSSETHETARMLVLTRRLFRRITGFDSAL